MTNIRIWFNFKSLSSGFSGFNGSMVRGLGFGDQGLGGFLRSKMVRDSSCN